MPVKLAIFDVDGTLLRGDTACLWMSRRLGNFERMSELERSPTRDHVIAARHEMAGWYSASSPDELLGDMNNFPWAPGIFEGIRELQQNGVTIALASLGWDFVVEKIARLFGITHTLATTLDFETSDVGHVWNNHKSEYGSKLSNELGIPASQIAGIGDRPNDFDLLDFAGHGIYVGPNSPPAEKNYTHIPNADIREIAEAILIGVPIS
ncbi:haloacid dehalogenase-like hydrolase [Dehalococcoides mccartyi]|nr:haloacid dehalogenase-like hydrolase [Dehalococcoides mccartyi]